MSKDIRSYFLGAGKKPQVKNDERDKSRKLIVITSDEEDTSPSKRRKAGQEAKKSKTHSKKRAIISSDEEDESEADRAKKKKLKVLSKNANHAKEEKLQEVDLTDVFKKKPVIRVEAPKVGKKTSEESKPKTITLIDFEDDDNFEETLNQLDTSKIEDEYLSALKSDKSPFFKNESKNSLDSKQNGNASNHKSDNKVHLSKLTSKDKSDKCEKSSPKKNKTPEKNHVEKKHESSKDKKNASEKEKKKKDQHHPQLEIEINSKPPKTKANKSSDNVDYIDIIEERVDRKKQYAIQYQNYLNRGGARNPGSKEVPQGAENCFAKLTFLITGVLESLEREEAEEIIKKYGGNVTNNVVKKLDYMIVGDQPGPSKMTKAESNGIKMISEDDFLDLLRTRPGVKSSETAESSNNKRKRESSVNADKKSPDKKKNKQESSEQEKHKSPEKTNKEDASKQSIKTEVKKEKSPVKLKEKEEKNKLLVEEKEEKNKLPLKVESSVIKTESTVIKTDTPISDVSNKLKDGVDHITALVEKYRPTEMKQIIGQNGDKSNAKKLHFWLKNWHNNHKKNSNAPKPKFNPYAKDDTGKMYKAALLSGPPGIGKTTTAYVVCKNLGFEVIEFNASDKRNRKLLQEEISGILKNRTVKSFLNAPDASKAPPKHVLLMDEVDGIAGTEDRGGLQELLNFVKTTEIPIICICNDRQNMKIKTLAMYTFDLRFSKPKMEHIRAAMMSICFKEGIKTTPDEITRIIQSTDQDIRQVINHVAVLSAKSSSSTSESGTNDKYKNLRLGPWEVVRKVFSASDHKNMSIHDKNELFFHDYNIAPLYVEENYLIVTPSGPREEHLEKVARCSESIAIGDMIDRSIRNGQNWGLLPVQAMFSSVIPGTEMSGLINSQINFPSWLGRNSTARKCDRMLQEVTVHARTVTGASKEAVNLDYLKMITHSVVRPLAVDGTEGVDRAVEVMSSYHLAREDLDSLLELTKWPHTRDLMQSVDTKTKAAFTRLMNKTLSYGAAAGATKKKGRGGGGGGDDDDGYDELEGEAGGEEVASDAEDDKLENDKLIKPKISKTTAKAGGSSADSKAKPKKAAATRGRKKKA